MVLEWSSSLKALRDMYNMIGLSIPSLHRESTNYQPESHMHKLFANALHSVALNLFSTNTAVYLIFSDMFIQLVQQVGLILVILQTAKLSIQK